MMRTLNVAYATLTPFIGKAPSYYSALPDGGYDVVVVGEATTCRTVIHVSDADAIADFEANYKGRCAAAPSPDDALLLGMAANKIPLVPPATPDGRKIVAQSTARRTTNFNLRGLWFYTARLGSLRNRHPVTDADYGDATLRLYDVDKNEITDPANQGSAVETRIDWEAHYNFEIIGGEIQLPTALKDGTTDRWELCVVGVPDYPPAYGGQLPYVNWVNLEAATCQYIVSDGRAISFMAYNYGGAPHTNRVRVRFAHPAGAQQRFQILLEHYV